MLAVIGGDAVGYIDFAKLRAKMREKGWTSYTVKRDEIIGQATWKKIQSGDGHIDTRTIAILCEVLECQPGDILEYVPNEDGGR